MTPTTATRAEQIAPDDPAADKSFTARELEQQEETLRETRRKLEELREEKAQLDDRIAQAVAGESDEDVEDLRERRQEVQELIEDFTAAVPLLGRRIRARRLRRLERLAEERLEEIKKRCGGLAGEQDRRVERAVEALEEGQKQLRAAGEAHALGEILKAEASVLARVFGLERPDLRGVPSPRSYQAITGGGGVRGWTDWSVRTPLKKADKKTEGARRELQRHDDPRTVIQRLTAIEVPLDSPAGDLLDRLEELQGGGEEVQGE